MKYLSYQEGVFCRTRCTLNCSHYFRIKLLPAFKVPSARQLKMADRDDLMSFLMGSTSKMPAAPLVVPTTPSPKLRDPKASPSSGCTRTPLTQPEKKSSASSSTSEKSKANSLPYRKASTTSLGETPKKKDGMPRMKSLPFDLATPNSAADPEPEDSQMQNEIDSVSRCLERDLRMSPEIKKPKHGKGQRKGNGKGGGKTTSKDEDKEQEDEVSENSEELCERLFEEADKKYAEDQEDEDLKSEDPIDSDEEINKPKPEKQSNPKPAPKKADHHSK